MERLTEKNAGFIGEEFWVSAREPDEEQIEEVYMKLLDYENAEEEGRLMKLPEGCPSLGSQVYVINDKSHIYTGKLLGYGPYSSDSKEFTYCVEAMYIATDNNIVRFVRYYDTIYKSKEEAAETLCKK